MGRIRRDVDKVTAAAEQAVVAEKALSESTGGTSSGPAGHRSAAGDPARLRGIPMIGGSSGAIPGTVPHRQRRLDRWSGRR